METVVQSQQNSDKYKFIIEETIKETNRVLAHWQNDGRKMMGYDDRLSLCRSHLAKFTKLKFGYLYYNQYIRWHNPLFIIDNNKVIGITFTESSTYTRQITEFITYVKNFDFVSFNIKNPIPKESFAFRGVKQEEFPEDIGKLIDYSKLDIKF